MDLKSIAEAYQSIQEGKVNAGLQAYLDKKKGKKENGEEKEEENGKESKGSKPDFLDLDKDGDKKEPMKKAAKEKKEETEHNYVNAYLDELKKTTMGSYIKKASKDVADRSFDHGESEKRQYEPDKETDKEGKKIDNRVKGIQTAAKKMAKELGSGHKIVTILCDFGTRYQSKLYNLEFLREKGLPVPNWLVQDEATKMKPMFVN